MQMQIDMKGYEGDFEDGKNQGNRVYYFVNGNRYEEVNDDKIKEGGIKYYDDGSYKLGELRNNMIKVGCLN